jgi:hypothetical protein
MLLRMSRGNFLQFGGQLRQDRDEPLDEGKLLLGQGSGRSTAMVGSQQRTGRSL